MPWYWHNHSGKACARHIDDGWVPLWLWTPHHITSLNAGLFNGLQGSVCVLLLHSELHLARLCMQMLDFQIYTSHSILIQKRVKRPKFAGQTGHGDHMGSHQLLALDSWGSWSLLLRCSKKACPCWWNIVEAPDFLWTKDSGQGTRFWCYLLLSWSLQRRWLRFFATLSPACDSRGHSAVSDSLSILRPNSWMEPSSWARDVCSVGRWAAWPAQYGDSHARWLKVLYYK